MAQRRDLALFVFIDALGWEIFSRYGLLNDLWQTAGPQDTILGYSCTCDPTILTGCLPCDHGHFSFFRKDPDHSPFRQLHWLDALPSRLVDRGRVRRVLSRLVAKVHGFTGYFQLYETPFEYLHYFDYTEKRDIYQPGGILGGQTTIFDELREQKVPFSLSDWRQPEAVNLQRLNNEVQSGQINFAYLYLAGLDAILHADGTQSNRAGNHLAWYEQQLRKLLATAESQYRNVRMYVFSDHGMTNVTQHLDLIGALQSLPLSFGTDYIAYYDSTMARFWFETPAAESAIREVLENTTGGRILNDAELEEFGILFPDRRYGELIFLCDPGVLICPSFMGKKPLAGMHGYDPAHIDSKATFTSSHSDSPVPKDLTEMIDVMRWEIEQLSRPSSIATATGVLA